MTKNNKSVVKRKLGITIFAIIEILIGSITIISIILSLILNINAKPPAVLAFVLVTSIISTCLGVGILRLKRHAFHMLIFLSTIIVFSKILIFTKIITLTGALETTIPQEIKNIISIFYHLSVIIYFSSKTIKEQFGERRNVFFSINMPFGR